MEQKSKNYQFKELGQLYNVVGSAIMPVLMRDASRQIEEDMPRSEYEKKIKIKSIKICFDENVTDGYVFHVHMDFDKR